MENIPVKFRRGDSRLPSIVTDGYLTLNAENGKLYSDFSQTRKAVSGYLFGVSSTPEDSTVKTVLVPGVPEYFNGLIVTVVFEHVDRLSTETLKLSIGDPDLGTAYLQASDLMVDPNTPITGADIEENVPYSFTWRDGQFLLVSGNLGARPKWKRLTDNKGF